MSFETNVFVNCPFDEDYKPLLRALLFTILDLGFSPRIALERLDSGEARIEKIIELVEESKFGIHDLSRLRAQKRGEFYRLNMPFELGLDAGCRRFKGGRWASKRYLILEAKSFRYQAALSDIAGSDIATHSDDATQIVSEVRNWLNSQAGLHAPGPTRIWNRFTDFAAKNYDDLINRGFSDGDIERLSMNELISEMKVWIAANPPG